MLVHCRHEFYHNQLTYYIAKAQDLSIDLQQKNLSIFFCIFRLTILSEYYILLKSHRTKPNCVKVARQTLTLFVRVRILLRLPPKTVFFEKTVFLFPFRGFPVTAI
mgnify:CR=1 FL=1